jgi:hypothetical protein
MADFDWQLYWAQFHYHSENNIKHLSELIRSGEPLTEGARNFIADVLLGKVKRKTGRLAKLNLEAIYYFEELTQNHNQDKAAELVLSKYPELEALTSGKEKKDSVGAFKKACQRMKPVMDECRRIEAEQYYESMVEIEQRAKADIAASRITESPISFVEEDYIFKAFQSMSADEKKYWRQRFEKFGQN